MTPHPDLTAVGRSLLAEGHFDNEPDAVLAAIWLLVCADALDRQPSLADGAGSAAEFPRG